MSDKKWRVAVIGCGGFANGEYLPNIEKTANAVCVAAVDIVYERALNACKKYAIANAYHSVDELLEKCEFDIAIDAASIQAHHEINMAVLGAGKHLISQKPASTTVAGITEQIELAERLGVKFACVPIHMITPDMLHVMQLIRDGAIGEVLSVKCVSTHGGPEYFQYRQADPGWFYEPGAGALYDMGVHALHKVTGIMGPAKRVSCMASCALPRRTVRSGTFDGKEIVSDKIPDTYFICLDFGDNRIGFVDTGFTQLATQCPPLEIYGSRGVISFKAHGGVWPEPDVYLDSPALGVRGWMTPMNGAINFRRPNFTQCCCLYDLIEAIEAQREPRLSARQARHVIEIMCAIPKAIETRTSVDLATTF